MLSLDFPDHLEQLGVKLDAAWKRQYGTRRRRRLMVAIAVLASLVVGGAAVAAGVFKSAAEEERGILDGHVLFSGSKPTCVPRSATVFRCTLEKPPTGMAFYEVDPGAANPKKPAPNEMKRVWDKFLGVKVETVNADKRIDGGCVSISADGRTWDCYLGQAAVEHEIIGPDLLGQYLPEPAAG
jgi:hypothetical protein